jgi:hypothetical protein
MDEIKELIGFVKPPGVSGFDVWIKSGESHSGRAYYAGSEYRSTNGNFRDRKGRRTKSTPTGKPESALLSNGHLFGAEKLVRLDMSEFMNQNFSPSWRETKSINAHSLGTTTIA